MGSEPDVQKCGTMDQRAKRVQVERLRILYYSYRSLVCSSVERWGMATGIALILGVQGELQIPATSMQFLDPLPATRPCSHCWPTHSLSLYRGKIYVKELPLLNLQFGEL